MMKTIFLISLFLFTFENVQPYSLFSSTQLTSKRNFASLNLYSHDSIKPKPLISTGNSLVGQQVVAEIEDAQNVRKDFISLNIKNGGEILKAKLLTENIPLSEKLALKNGLILRVKVIDQHHDGLVVELPTFDFNSIDLTTPINIPVTATPTKKLNDFSIPDLENFILLKDLKVGQKLTGTVVQSNAKMAFLACNVYRYGKANRPKKVNGFIKRKDAVDPTSLGNKEFPEYKASLFPIGSELTLYVKDVQQNSGTYALTMDPSFSRSKLKEEKLKRQEMKKQRSLTRRLQNLLHEVLPGDMVTGKIKEVTADKIYVRVQSLGNLEVIGMIEVKNLPKVFDAPKDLSDNSKAQILALDFQADREIVCSVIRANPTPAPELAYNLQLSFEKFGPEIDLLSQDEIDSLPSESFQETNDNISDNNSDNSDNNDDQDSENDQENAMTPLSEDENEDYEDDDIIDEIDIGEVYSELKANKRQLLVRQLLNWNELEEMKSLGYIKDQDINDILDQHLSGWNKNTEISLETFETIYDELFLKVEEFLQSNEYDPSAASNEEDDNNNQVDGDEEKDNETESKDNEEGLNDFNLYESYEKIKGTSDILTAQGFLNCDDVKTLFESKLMNKQDFIDIVKKVSGTYYPDMEIPFEVFETIYDEVDIFIEKKLSENTEHSKEEEFEDNYEDNSLVKDEVETDEDVSEEVSNEEESKDFDYDSLYQELCGNKNHVTVNDFLAWDEIDALKASGYLDDDFLFGLLHKNIPGFNPKDSKNSFGLHLSKTDFIHLSDSIQARINEVEESIESQNDIMGEQSDSWDQISQLFNSSNVNAHIDFTKPIPTNISVNENDVAKVDLRTFFTSETAFDNLNISQAYNSLIGTHPILTLKSIHQWDVLQELIEKGPLTKKDIDHIFRLVWPNSSESTQVTQEMFMYFINLLSMKMDFLTLEAEEDLEGDIIPENGESYEQLSQNSRLDQLTTSSPAVQSLNNQETEAGDDYQEDDENDFNPEELFHRLKGKKENLKVRELLAWEELDELKKEEYITDRDIKSILTAVLGKKYNLDTNIPLKEFISFANAIQANIDAQDDEENAKDNNEEAGENNEDFDETDEEEFDPKDEFDELRGKRPGVPIQTLINWEAFKTMEFVSLGEIKAIISGIVPNLNSKTELNLEQFSTVLDEVEKLELYRFEKQEEKLAKDKGNNDKSRNQLLAESITAAPKMQKLPTEPQMKLQSVPRPSSMNASPQSDNKSLSKEDDEDDDDNGDMSDEEVEAMLKEELSKEFKVLAKSKDKKNRPVISMKDFLNWDQIKSILAEENISRNDLESWLRQQNYHATSLLTFDDFYELMNKMQDEFLPQEDSTEDDEENDITDKEGEVDDEEMGIEDIFNEISNGKKFITIADLLNWEGLNSWIEEFQLEKSQILAILSDIKNMNLLPPANSPKDKFSSIKNKSTVKVDHSKINLDVQEFEEFMNALQDLIPEDDGDEDSDSKGSMKNSKQIDAEEMDVDAEGDISFDLNLKQTKQLFNSLSENGKTLSVKKFMASDAVQYYLQKKTMDISNLKLFIQDLTEEKNPKAISYPIFEKLLGLLKMSEVLNSQKGEDSE